MLGYLPATRPRPRRKTVSWLCHVWLKKEIYFLYISVASSTPSTIVTVFRVEWKLTYYFNHCPSDNQGVHVVIFWWTHLCSVEQILWGNAYAAPTFFIHNPLFFNPFKSHWSAMYWLAQYLPTHYPLLKRNTIFSIPTDRSSRGQTCMVERGLNGVNLDWVRNQLRDSSHGGSRRESPRLTKRLGKSLLQGKDFPAGSKY